MDEVETMESRVEATNFESFIKSTYFISRVFHGRAGWLGGTELGGNLNFRL